MSHQAVSMSQDEVLINLFPPLPENVHTDEEAEHHLPPYPIARRTYQCYRGAGNDPQEALLLTLEDWRNYMEYARPQGYGRAHREQRR